MSRLADLPTREQVCQARDHVIAEAHAVGRRPSVLVLARRFGLPNTTFRRNFPDIVRELGEVRRTPISEIAVSPDSEHYVTRNEQNAKLRHDKATLTEHLELAVANIQRLTLENRQLRDELETVNKVTKIGAKAADLHRD